ncbi:MAG: hypothetical protein GC153_08985 [Alphaproteobacteria bacterium]|nr:hypothetical protein [Alphaproteobacteria bacterium]
MTRLAFAGAIAGLALLAGPLSAAPYPGVSAIAARDFTGTLEINVGGATIEATLSKGRNRIRSK